MGDFTIPGDDVVEETDAVGTFYGVDKIFGPNSSPGNLITLVATRLVLNYDELHRVIADRGRVGVLES